MYRRHNSSRVLFNLEGMDEEWYEESVILCVPRFAWMAARTFIKGYGLRHINYSETTETGGYYSPGPAVFDKIDASIGRFLEAGDMTCDLAALLERGIEAIEGIETSLIASLKCGTTCGGEGSFGAGTTGSPESDFEDQGENVPDGFDDLEEYRLYKCGVANALIASMKLDLEWLKTSSIVSFTATIMAAALLTPIPLDDLLVLVGFVVLSITQGLLVDLAAELQTIIDENVETLVCILYQAGTAEEAATGLEEFFGAEASASAFVLIAFFINYDAMNALFEFQTQWQNNSLTRNVDCDTDCTEHYTERGEQVSANVWESQEIVPTNHSVAISFFSGAWLTSSEPTRKIQISNVSAPGFDPNDDHVFAAKYTDDVSAIIDSDCVPWPVYCDNVLPVGLFCVKKLVFRSKVPFTVTFTFLPVEC